MLEALLLDIFYTTAQFQPNIPSRLAGMLSNKLVSMEALSTNKVEVFTNCSRYHPQICMLPWF